MSKTLQDIATEIVEQYPNAAARAIARRLVELYPELFLTIEQARTVVRVVIGQRGDRNRHRAKAPRPARNAGEWRRPIPEPVCTDRSPVRLPAQNTLVLSDLHAPYHEPKALELALSYTADVQTVYLNGDILDCHRISRFVPDLQAVSFAEELRIGRELLSCIRDRFPSAAIYYKLGNHEERLHDYLAMRAPEIADVEEWRLDHLLRLNEHGIIMVDNRRMARLSGLSILHGHELTRGLIAPVNPARGAYLKAACHMLIGHFHRTSEHNETSALGELTSTWSAGCLCNLNPFYNPYGKANHGFAYVECGGNDFTVHNRRIYKGMVR